MLLQLDETSGLTELGGGVQAEMAPTDTGGSQLANEMYQKQLEDSSKLLHSLQANLDLALEEVSNLRAQYMAAERFVDEVRNESRLLLEEHDSLQRDLTRHEQHLWFYETVDRIEHAIKTSRLIPAALKPDAKSDELHTYGEELSRTALILVSYVQDISRCYRYMLHFKDKVPLASQYTPKALQGFRAVLQAIQSLFQDVAWPYATRVLHLISADAAVERRLAQSALELRKKTDAHLGMNVANMGSLHASGPTLTELKARLMNCLKTETRPSHSVTGERELTAVIKAVRPLVRELEVLQVTAEATSKRTFEDGTVVELPHSIAVTQLGVIQGKYLEFRQRMIREETERYLGQLSNMLRGTDLLYALCDWSIDVCHKECDLFKALFGFLLSSNFPVFQALVQTVATSGYEVSRPTILAMDTVDQLIDSVRWIRARTEACARLFESISFRTGREDRASKNSMIYIGDAAQLTVPLTLILDQLLKDAEERLIAVSSQQYYGLCSVMVPTLFPASSGSYLGFLQTQRSYLTANPGDSAGLHTNDVYQPLSDGFELLVGLGACFDTATLEPIVARIVELLSAAIYQNAASLEESLRVYANQLQSSTINHLIEAGKAQAERGVGISSAESGGGSGAEAGSNSDVLQSQSGGSMLLSPTALLSSATSVATTATKTIFSSLWGIASTLTAATTTPPATKPAEPPSGQAESATASITNTSTTGISIQRNDGVGLTFVGLGLEGPLRSEAALIIASRGFPALNGVFFIYKYSGLLLSTIYTTCKLAQPNELIQMLPSHLSVNVIRRQCQESWGQILSILRAKPETANLLFPSKSGSSSSSWTYILIRQQIRALQSAAAIAAKLLVGELFYHCTQVALTNPAVRGSVDDFFQILETDNITPIAGPALLKNIVHAINRLTASVEPESLHRGFIAPRLVAPGSRVAGEPASELDTDRVTTRAEVHKLPGRFHQTLYEFVSITQLFVSNLGIENMVLHELKLCVTDALNRTSKVLSTRSEPTAREALVKIGLLRASLEMLLPGHE